MDIFNLKNKAIDYYQQKAVEHYESFKKNKLRNGWQKVIVTNGVDCLFVNRGYNPGEDEYVFILETRNNITYCELLKQPGEISK